MQAVKIILKPSNAKGKRFRAIILYSDESKKTINFGSVTGSTFIDHKDKVKKKNYIARHRVNENWREINAGSLARFLLWNKKSLAASIKDFEHNFKIKFIM